MKTLKLFNAVIYKESTETPYTSEDGLIIESSAVWAKDRITEFYANELLNGNDFNKTFHKSWKKIIASDRSDLLIEQIKHYVSTYGSNFSSEAYIPDELINIPKLKLKFKVIKGYYKSEMTKKCLSLLTSGIALKEDTINDVIEVLVDELDYKFTGEEGIKNKEAIVKIADMYNVLPKDILEFFRYIIYKTTNESLLIKNIETIEAIKKSSFNPSAQFKQFGLDKLSSIFNRFKPLFLAYKTVCPKTINKISKLSKTNHKAMVTNPLNVVTSTPLNSNDINWLDSATPFTLFRALHACKSRMKDREGFVYKIRNGKSWTKPAGKQNKVVKQNFDFIMNYMKGRFNMTGTKIYLPENIKFGLPTSEKMYSGNIPVGTRFYGDKLAVGVYWENDWGASDLDLSAINIGGKIGWNSEYSKGSLSYSGDITDAPDGAVEYLHANEGLSEPSIVMNNVYHGDNNSGYKIVIGKGSKVDKNFMMNPNKVFADIKTESVQRQTILGILIPKKDKQCFVLLNFGSGSANVSGNSELTSLSTKALCEEWFEPFSFNKLIKELGAEVVNDKKAADYDFSLDVLEKDSFTKLFI
jgi:hypothetical protein